MCWGGRVTQLETWTLPGHAGDLAGRTRRGPDPHRVAVQVPGIADHHGRNTDQAEAQADAGAVVVGYDLAGHGESAGERALLTDLESTVDDLGVVLSRAGKENLPIVLIGCSLGGAIVTRHAQRHPGAATALVLAGPVLGTWPGIDLLAEDPLPTPAIDPAQLTRDPAAAAAFGADPLVWHGPFPRPTLEAIDEALRTIDFDHPLGDELPALWLHGDDDRIAPVADTRTGMDRVRGLRFVEHIYPGARHDLFHETNTAEVLADLLAFVHATLPPS